MALDFGTILFVFVAISLLVTFLIKKFTKADTFVLISLLKTKKPLAFFDRAAKHTYFLDKFAALGLILGLGALAVDFLYGRKLSAEKRALLFLGSFSVLVGIIFSADILLGHGLSTSSLIGPYFPLLAASFGLLGLAGFTLFSLILQAFDIVSNYLVGRSSCPGVAPLIPGVEIPGVPITPPLHAWISLIIILVCHEAMHGIIGRRHKFEIKSTGILLFGPLPIGAFVEPDEKELNKAEDEKVLPFLAAGPMANITLMAIAGIILFASLSIAGPLTDALYPGIQQNVITGVKVGAVLEETLFCGQSYPSSAFNRLHEGDIIKKINGDEINNLQDLFNALQKDRYAAKTFLLERNGEEVSITLEPNELGQFGFRPEGIRDESVQIPESFTTYAAILSIIVDFLYWLFLLNFLVASINFLPVHPFDGGRISKILFVPYLWFIKGTKEEKQRIIGKVFVGIILALFIINALPLFF